MLISWIQVRKATDLTLSFCLWQRDIITRKVTNHLGNFSQVKVPPGQRRKNRTAKWKKSKIHQLNTETTSSNWKHDIFIRFHMRSIVAHSTVWGQKLASDIHVDLWCYVTKSSTYCIYHGDDHTVSHRYCDTVSHSEACRVRWLLLTMGQMWKWVEAELSARCSPWAVTSHNCCQLSSLCSLFAGVEAFWWREDTEIPHLEVLNVATLWKLWFVQFCERSLCCVKSPRCKPRHLHFSVSCLNMIQFRCDWSSVRKTSLEIHLYLAHTIT